MTDEADMAMELSKALNANKKLEERLLGLMNDAMAYSCLTTRLIEALIQNNSKDMASITKTLIDWNVDIDIQLLLNLISPAGQIRFVPENFQTLSTREQDKFIEKAMSTFTETATPFSKLNYNVWDTFAAAQNRGTRQQRIEQARSHFLELAQQGAPKHGEKQTAKTH